MTKLSYVLPIIDSTNKKIEPYFLKSLTHLISIYKHELIKFPDNEKKEKLSNFWKNEYRSILGYDRNNRDLQKIYFENELQKSLFLMKFS